MSVAKSFNPLFKPSSEPPSRDGVLVRDGSEVAELDGRLVLIYVIELHEGMTTKYGVVDAISAYVIELDPDQDEYDMMIYGQALVDSLRAALGGLPVLGRVGRGTAEPGQSAPWILQPYTDDDAQFATGWIAAWQPLFSSVG